jgi:hypothetical protein
MHEDSNISKMRAALRRQGVWGSRAERLLQEWADHVRDDVAHRVESGVEHVVAETAAWSKLGTSGDLATHAARELTGGLWLGRHPWVAGLAIPVLVWLLTVAALGFGGAWLLGPRPDSDAHDVNLAMLEWWPRVFNWLPWLLSLSWLAWMAGRMPGGWKLFWITTVVLALFAPALHMSVDPPLNGPGSGFINLFMSGPDVASWSDVLRARGMSAAWFQSAFLVAGGLLVRFWATHSRPKPGQVAIPAVLVLVAPFLLLWSPSAAAQTTAEGYYEFQPYNPTVAYDYREEFGPINPPTQVLNDVTGVVGTYTSGWWVFRYGADKNPLVTSAAWIPMIERLNTDFDYITDVMRWPRDVRARNGYYSTVFLYGSGLSTDNAPNTATGGWQGTTTCMGEEWPMVLASYVPVYAFDPANPDGKSGYQTGGMVHEGIHAILSSMPGVKNAGWFHEGGNTWLQGTMEAQRSGNFSSMGWLSAGAAIAPFMPIECYSGWLQDGSFGGPSAEGVNVYSGSTQLCTWRNKLGGTQYGEVFPHALEVILGPRSIAWIWRNATQSGRVLQDLAEAPGGIGGAQMRRLIQEFRARQAFCDFGQWSYAYRNLLQNNWNVAIRPEYEPIWMATPTWNATCYVATTQTANLLTPEARTLPGWSGANQIPLVVSADATTASVTFNPTGQNMMCQLAYRDTSGRVRYGVPVSSGECGIKLENVRNNVVVAVICNTDYVYEGDATRKAKYGYTLELGAGISGKADIYKRWYDYTASSYTVETTAGPHGTISPAGSVKINAGGNRAFTFTPATGYAVSGIYVNDVYVGKLSSYTFNNVRGSHTIRAEFAPPGVSLWASGGANGVVSPSGEVLATPGADQTFLFTPHTGFTVQDVTVGGVSVGAVTRHTLTNVQADQIVLAKFGGNPASVPRAGELLFACLTESLPRSGLTGPWSIYLPGGGSLSTLNSPTSEVVGNVTWIRNSYGDHDGYLFGHYVSAIPVNGASIVVAVQPERNSTDTAWSSVVDAFYQQLVLSVKNQTGQVQIRCNGTHIDTGVIIPNGQKTILSLVVQPNGSYRLYTNGTLAFTQDATSAFTAMGPGGQSYMHDINIGRNSPDDWSTFNGLIGDVFFYKVALSDPERQQLETRLTNKFIATNHMIEATCSNGGMISPLGPHLVLAGESATYTATAQAGYRLSELTVDGTPLGPLGNYTFNEVNENHTIRATFEAVEMGVLGNFENEPKEDTQPKGRSESKRR